MRTGLYKTACLGIILASFTAVSCSVGVSTSAARPATAKKVPPGQAKKANGDKSARRYAPGQNKS